MKTAAELRKIAKQTRLKRETNEITCAIINKIEDNLLHLANTYGDISFEMNIGYSILKDLGKELKSNDPLVLQGKSKESIKKMFSLEEKYLRKYFTDLGYSIQFKNIGMIEDKTVVVSA